MEKVNFTRLLMPFLCLSALFCMMSCSSDSDEVYEPTDREKGAYNYFKKRGYGSEGYENFDGLEPFEVNSLMQETWNRDTMVLASGERKLLTNWSVKITNNHYIEKKGGKVTMWRLKGDAKTENGKLIYELEGGGVVQYDSIRWSADRCTVMLTDQDGNTYCDNRKAWANTRIIYWWCSVRSPFIY